MKKIIQSTLMEDVEVLTDNGWVDCLFVHKTIPYEVYHLKLLDGKNIKCADNHIVFYKDNMKEVFVKNLQIGDKICVFGDNMLSESEVVEIVNLGFEENMFDLELGVDSNHRYYTDGILSHNTSYIKYLTKLIEDKEILFIPPSMAESLSEPSIIPFLMEHKNSILIIEDAEKVISDREFNGSSAGVSNILNLTDGILGDCLNIQIVATFNMKREKIDPALLRKGRLIAEHKFTPLSVENSNILLKNLGSSKTVEGPTSLADIYNIDEELFRVENNKKIGF
jgi:hypothetical protein